MASKLNGEVVIPLIISLLGCSTAGENSKTAIREGAITRSATMSLERSGHTATLLPDGDVLIAGGMNGNGTYFAECELYSSATHRTVPVPSMSGA